MCVLCCVRELGQARTMSRKWIMTNNFSPNVTIMRVLCSTHSGQNHCPVQQPDAAWCGEDNCVLPFAGSVNLVISSRVAQYTRSFCLPQRSTIPLCRLVANNKSSRKWFLFCLSVHFGACKRKICGQRQSGASIAHSTCFCLLCEVSAAKFGT